MLRRNIFLDGRGPTLTDTLERSTSVDRDGAGELGTRRLPVNLLRIFSILKVVLDILRSLGILVSRQLDDPGEIPLNPVIDTDIQPRRPSIPQTLIRAARTLQR